MNAWLLFRNAQVKILQNQNPEEKQAQGQLSKVSPTSLSIPSTSDNGLIVRFLQIIAELWKSAAPEVGPFDRFVFS
jgi:hypothetical protein